VKKDLEQRTICFSLAAIKFADALPRNLRRMFLHDSSWRSRYFIGAIIAKQNRGVSRADFANKFGTVQKEAFGNTVLDRAADGGRNRCSWIPRKTFTKKLLNCSRSSPQLARNLSCDCFLLLLYPFYFLHDHPRPYAYHGDSAACLFVDGKLIAAAEEERFRRVKHWAGLPTQASITVCAKAG